MTTIIGTPVVESGDWLDMITPAEAILDPNLAAVSVSNARLAQLITVASMQIQRYIGRTFTAAQIAALTDDLKYAATLYTAFLWAQDTTGVAGDYANESLGDYSYGRATAALRGTRLGRITALLAPYCSGSGPAIIPSADWAQAKSEL